MSIWDRVKAMLPRREQKPRSRDEPDNTRMVGRTRADIGMTASETIFAAVNRIASTFASMPMHLYKGDEIAHEHPLERLISYAPNDCLTGYLWRLTMMASACADGNGYSLIIPSVDGSQPAMLDVLRPELVTPHIEESTRELWYQVSDTINGTQYWVHSSRMIHIRFVGGNGVRGMRPMQILSGTLSYDYQIKSFSLEQLASVNNAVMLTVPTVGLSKEAKDAAINDFLDRYKKSGRSVVVLEGGITADSMSRSPVDARVLDVERITKNRVATVYGIPPHMMGDYSDTSYSTAEQSMLEFLQLTMLPWVSQGEAELNRKLLTWDMLQQGYHFLSDMAVINRADTATLAIKNTQGVRGAWITPNEARQVDGKPGLPGGDELYISRDLLPLRLVTAGATVKAEWAVSEPIAPPDPQPPPTTGGRKKGK